MQIVKKTFRILAQFLRIYFNVQRAPFTITGTGACMGERFELKINSSSGKEDRGRGWVGGRGWKHL